MTARTHSRLRLRYHEAVSRHGQYRDTSVRWQLVMPRDLLERTCSRAEEASETWGGTRVPTSAIVREAVKQYLAKPLPKRRPNGFDEHVA